MAGSALPMDPMDVDDDDTYVAAGSRYSRGCWALARLAERELLARDRYGCVRLRGLEKQELRSIYTSTSGRGTHVDYF